MSVVLWQNHNRLLMLSSTILDHLLCWSKAGVHSSNLMAGQKFRFAIFKAQKWYGFTPSNCVSIIQTRKKNKNFGCAGQIKSFRGPQLARGVYVVHAWSKVILSGVNFTLILWATFAPVDLRPTYWRTAQSVQRKSWADFLVLWTSRVGRSLIGETEQHLFVPNTVRRCICALRQWVGEIDPRWRPL